MSSSPEASSSDEEVDTTSAVKAESSANSNPADASRLFSDDEDESESDEEKDRKSSAGNARGRDKDKDKEMEDLFGSDYDSGEEEFKASGIKESPVRDEDRDAFGDDYNSGEGGARRNEVWLPRLPHAHKSVQYFLCKMPNILRLVTDAYTQESINEEMKNPSDETLYRNYVRWRYQRDADGKVKLDPDTKLPMRQSNTKLVEWEDGTLTMFVGKEALSLSKQHVPNSFVFVNTMASDRPQADENPEASSNETVLECHGRLKEKFTIRPMTTQSKSHKSLTMSMRAKHNKGVQRIKEYISEMDGEREQEQRAKINDDRLRLQNRKKARQTYEYDRERSSRMDASFLEEGYESEEGENVAAIKEQYGGRNRNKVSATRRSPHGRRPSGQHAVRGGFDEYTRNREAEKSDSEQEQEDDLDDEDEEEEVIARSSRKRRMVDEDSD